MLDYPYHRKLRKSFPEHVKAGGAYGIACDHKHFNILGHEEIRYLLRIFSYGGYSLGSIRSPRRISEIYHSLVREFFEQSGYGCQSSES